MNPPAATELEFDKVQALVVLRSQRLWETERSAALEELLIAGIYPLMACQHLWQKLRRPRHEIQQEPVSLLDSVCVNMLGSPYGSSSPASIDPETGKPYLLDFPDVTVRDIIAATILVRKHLGINTIDLLIGSSIGGFQAIEWAVTEPSIFRNAMFIATEPRVSPWLLASVETQRMALRADASYLEARDIHGGEEGLKCARAIAMVSYRCFQGYSLTQSETDVDTLFADRAASYERYQGAKLVRRGFDAYSYNSLSTSVTSNNVGRGRGGVEAALGTIKASTTVVSVDTDGLFPPFYMESWARFIPGADYRVVSSNFGHDAFLIEIGQFSEIIGGVLSTL